MKKKLKYFCIIGVLLSFFALVGHRYYRAQLDQKRLEHVLNLNEVPEGVSIRATAADVWTDEVLHFVLELHDGAIKKVTSGREYARTRVEPFWTAHGGYTKYLPDFEVHYRYSTGDGLWGVWIETDETENLAYVMFAAD